MMFHPIIFAQCEVCWQCRLNGVLSCGEMFTLVGFAFIWMDWVDVTKAQVVYVLLITSKNEGRLS
jgi:hypothetical protein